ncbi:MAG: hypothetical protein ABI850_17270 [Flavobacterium sp.]
MKNWIVSNANVIVFNTKSELPANFSTIGTVKIGYTGFTTNCDFATILEVAKTEARKKSLLILPKPYQDKPV